MNRNLWLTALAGAFVLSLATRARARANAKTEALMQLPVGFFEGVADDYRIYATVALDKANTADMPAAGLVYQLWIESAFNPLAVSPRGAAGLGQFMPGAGVDYGLITMPAAAKEAYYNDLAAARASYTGDNLTHEIASINSAMLESPVTRDNRFIAWESIDAAIRYMKKLHKTRVDQGRDNPWSLALAGYHAGPGRVNQFLSGTRSLPAQTLAYVRRIARYYGEQPEWAQESNV